MNIVEASCHLGERLGIAKRAKRLRLQGRMGMKNTRLVVGLVLVLLVSLALVSAVPAFARDITIGVSIPQPFRRGAGHGSRSS